MLLKVIFSEKNLNLLFDQDSRSFGSSENSALLSRARVSRSLGQVENEGLETHLWVGNHSREITIDGKPIVLYRCPLCSRDFSREPDESSWRAILVSTFRIAYLPDEVSQEWLTEPCPGRPRPSPKQLPVLEAAEPPVISATPEPEVNPRRVVLVVLDAGRRFELEVRCNASRIERDRGDQVYGNREFNGL